MTTNFLGRATQPFLNPALTWSQCYLEYEAYCGRCEVGLAEDQPGRLIPSAKYGEIVDLRTLVS